MSRIPATEQNIFALLIFCCIKIKDLVLFIQRKDVDRDKTPVAAVPKTTSTISRLESKYSDALGRVARRRQEEDDREKTLEPERPYVNPISRSATTVMLGDKALAAYQKERTPYKLGRNRSRYDFETNFKPRSELSLLQDNNRYKTKHDAHDPIRRKDTLYDAYNRNGRYNSTLSNNNLNHHRSRPGISDYGYYDGGGKENSFKSKYDPDMIYSEINNNYLDPFNGSAAIKERERKRAIRSYKRTDTSNDRRHTTHLKEFDDESDIPSTSRFTNRKSYQRSQTQKFFDSENLYASNNNHHSDNGMTAEASSVVPNEAMTEREARRKEIQSLIMKYAQLDDVYSKPNDDQANNNVKKVDTFGLMPSTSSVAVSQKNGGFVPLSKTQTVAAMSSIRSRIPKALSTFVRFII